MSQTPRRRTKNIRLTLPLASITLSSLKRPGTLTFGGRSCPRVPAKTRKQVHIQISCIISDQSIDIWWRDLGIYNIKSISQLNNTTHETRCPYNSGRDFSISSSAWREITEDNRRQIDEGLYQLSRSVAKDVTCILKTESEVPLPCNDDGEVNFPGERGGGVGGPIDDHFIIYSMCERRCRFPEASQPLE